MTGISERLSPALFDDLEDLFYIHDLEGNICYINNYVLKLLGYAPQDVLNKNIMDFLHPQYQKQYSNYLQSIPAKKSAEGILRIMSKEGRERLLEYRNVVYYSDGKPVEVRGIARDITERQWAEKALTDALGRFESIIENTPVVAVQGFDVNGCIYHWNPVSERLYGMSLKEVLEKPFHELFLEGKSAERFKEDLNRVFIKGIPVETREFTITTASGEKRWVYSNMFPVFEGGRCIEAIRMEIDITERKKAEERLEYLSTHDPLTGIYNRAYFEEEMRRLENPRFRPVSIIVCDVDFLKFVNDNLGHDKGDILLKAAAETIRAPFRSSDMVARIGGDEFAVILPLTSKDVAIEACRRIEEQLESYNQSNPLLPLSISLGVSTSISTDCSLIETFKEADSAMYQNKIEKAASARTTIVKSLLSNVNENFFAEETSRKRQSMAVALAKEAGLSQKEINSIAILSLVYDIGKVGIPDNIIYKKGELLPEEKITMQKHTEIGHRIALFSSELALVADYILSHHEWWNGGGYPYGLKEKEIPIASRIIAIVDAYNAMTNERPYRSRLTHEEAIAEIKRCAGTQFDPEIVEKFVELFG